MKIISNTLNAIFILLLLGVAGLFLASLLPIPGNFEVKIVKSGSMEPTIATGSIVIVKPESEYRAGDIITFGEDTRQQIPTTHRILSVRKQDGRTYFETKGDANEEADPNPVGDNEVLGKVVAHVPYAGFVLDFAKQPLGFTLMIGIPAGIIILDELWKIVRELRRLRRKKPEKPTRSLNIDGITYE